MKVINLFAGPGAGKSTTAAGIFYNLKMRGLNVELVTEYAKELTWEKRMDILSGDQLYVFAKQNRRLSRLKGQVDFVVTDSPLLLSLVYGDHMGENFKNFARETFDSYDNVNYMINRTKKYNPIGRNEDENGARELDEKTRKILEECGYPYTLTQSSETAVDDIMNDLFHEKSSLFEETARKIIRKELPDL